MSETKQWILWSIVGANFGLTLLIHSAIVEIRGRLIVIAERLYPPFPVVDD